MSRSWLASEDGLTAYRIDEIAFAGKPGSYRGGVVHASR